MNYMYLLFAYLSIVSGFGQLGPYSIKKISNVIANQVSKGILTSKSGTVRVKGPLSVSVSSKYHVYVDSTFGKKTKDSSCLDFYKSGFHTNGVYYISPGLNRHTSVYCEMKSAGGGWTVFQHRFNGSVDFYRKWSDYKNGFGDIYGEYWLGNDNIHLLTEQGKCTLRIEMGDFSGVMKFAEYSDFKLSKETDGYKISFGKYSGTAGDSLTRGKHMKFTTKDVDHDTYSANCAKLYKGGWWYESCHRSNLNGLYLKGKHKSYADGMEWYHWHGYNYSLKSTKMMVKCV